MRESDIDKRFEQHDKDVKNYVDMKFRALKKPLAPFIWASKNPGKAVIAMVILFMLSALAFHMIDLRKTIEKRFDIELKDADIQ